MSKQVGFRVRGRVGAIFLARHAISAADAIAFVPDARDARAFARLRAAGVVKDVGAGRYWFDLPAYFARAEAFSGQAVIGALIAAVCGAIIAVMLYQG